MPSILDDLDTILREENSSGGIIQDLQAIQDSVLAPAGPLGVRKDRIAMPTGTSLSLNTQRRRSQLRAERETRRLERDFRRVGRLDEFNDFVQREGEVGPLAESNYIMTNVLDPTFDLLQIGQFTTVGFIQELLKTGNIGEAFKHGAVEFANALPGVEIEGAREPSWSDILSNQGASRWGAASLGLVLDIVLDPINVVPGALLAKSLAKGGRGALRASRPLRSAFDFLFTPQRELSALGPAGEAMIQIGKDATTAVQNQTVAAIDKIDELVGWMQPHERRMMSAWGDQPMIMEGELRALARAGIGDIERVPETMKVLNNVADYTKELINKEIAEGVSDPLMVRSWYVHGAEAQVASERRAWERMIHGRVPDDGRTVVRGMDALGPSGKTPDFAKPRSTNTQGDRIGRSLEGDFLYSTETDIRNVLIRRSVEHIRWMNFRKFLDVVTGDGRVAARVVDKNPKFFQGAGWPRLQASIQKNNPALDVFEVTKKVRVEDVGVKEGAAIDEVIGAYILPKPIVDALKGMNKTFSEGGDLGEFMQKADELMNIWRGWATLSVSFHSRNYLSILFMNWLAGVGAKYGVKGIEGRPGDFVLRHLQALKMQTMAEGAGRLPPKAKKWADRLAKASGHGSFEKISMPVIKDETGRVIGAEEIIRIGESHGVPQTVSRLHNLPDEMTKDVWSKLDDTVPIEAIEKAEGISDVTKAALTIGRNEPSTLGEKLNKIAGTDNPLLKANRAWAQVVENNGRWALFLDGFMKGDPADVAAKATKTWHFDYRNLTEIEKRLFRFIIPFYAWQRFAVPRMAMAIVEQPGKFARLPKIKQAMENLHSDWKDLPQPDYYDEVQMLQIPYLHKDRPLFAQVDLPVMDLNKLNYKDVMSSLNPVAKMFIENAPPGGHNIFLDMPIERFPGQKSEGLPFMDRKAEHRYANLFPPFGRFVARPAKALKRDEFEEWAIGEIIGIKFRALDSRRVLRGRAYQRQKMARQFRDMLREEGVLQ